MVARFGFERGPQSEWTYLLPPSAPSPVVFPQLPEAVSAYAPDLDVNFQAPSVFLIDLAATDGFPDFKQINTRIFEDEGLPMISGGRVSIGGAFN